MAKRIVICLDGTSNEPEKGKTNVARLFDMLFVSDTQLVYYDPGVGTMGARSATSRLGKSLSRVGGLAFGHGVKENVAEAYRFLMLNYEKGDRVFIFGFSRGAYTARALVGLLRTVGLLRPGAENLIPYAIKLYTKKDPAEGPPKLTVTEKQKKKQKEKQEEEKKEYWELRDDFGRSFGNPAFPNRFDWNQVHFLGAWDTVKFVGWFNWKAQFEQARWPFTRKAVNVAHTRHAVAIDEKRRYYKEYRFDSGLISDNRRDAREVWFAGVHSDVGGTFDDHHLADISLKWMVDEATADSLAVDSHGKLVTNPDLAKLDIDGKRYEQHVGAKLGEDLPSHYAEDPLHPAPAIWAVIGLGWRPRKIEEGDDIHPSVLERMNGSGERPYLPRIPGMNS